MTGSTKAQIISDDGDLFEVGNYVVCIGNSGMPCLGIIRALTLNNDIDGRAQVEIVDAYLDPTGEMCNCGLAMLVEYNVMPASEDDETPDGAGQPASKATPGVNSPDDDWAYVPKDGPKSGRKLYIGDEQHVKLAVQAFTEGMEGNKTKGIPSDARDTVKSRISGAIDSKISDKNEKAYYHEWLNSGKKPDRAPDEAKKSIIPTIAGLDLPSIAVKSISDDGYEIGGHLVLFGDSTQPDLQGDWFTGKTEFHIDWYPRIPILFEHTKDGVVKSTAVGTITERGVDDLGVWVKGVLDRSNRYVEHIKTLIKDGRMGWSSGSMSHIVQPPPNPRTGVRGEIKEWALCEASLTVTPAEPRTLGVPIKHFIEPRTAELAYKSMGLPLENLNLPQEVEQGSAQDGARFGNAASKSLPASNAKKTTYRKQDGTKMELTSEQLAELIQKGIADAETKKAADLAAKSQAEELDRLRKENEALKNQPPAAPIKSLPGGQGILPQQNPAAPQTQPVVIGDRRYADLASTDMAFLADLYKGVMDGQAQKRVMRPSGYEPQPLEIAASKFYRDFADDPDRKLQRLICAKAVREVAQNKMDSRILEYLPYQSQTAIEANNYNEEAVKAAREEARADRAEAIKSGAIKANELDNTGQSTFGAEWVPTIWNNEAWRRVRIANPFAGMMQSVNMPSNPWNYPIESTDPTVFYIAEATDAAQLVLGASNTLALSKAGTNKVQFTAKKLGAHIGFSVEEQEDSIIAVVPIWRYQTQRALQNYVDDTVVNGDTTTSANTNINLIDSTPAAGTSYLAMDGIRKYALVTNTAQAIDFGGGAPTLAQFRNLRKTLNKHYAADIPNLVYVVGFEVYMKMLGMPEFSAFQNSGVLPTALTGLLPSGDPNQVSDTARPVGLIDGIPVYISAQINLAQSNGKISNTPSNNTLGSAVLFHRSRLIIGYRRAINTELLSTAVFSDTYQIWGTVRFALQYFDTTSAAVGYDIAV